jgi:hypothetical protein
MLHPKKNDHLVGNECQVQEQMILDISIVHGQQFELRKGSQAHSKNKKGDLTTN